MKKMFYLTALLLPASLCCAQQTECFSPKAPASTRTVAADINNDGLLDRLEVKSGILSVYYGMPNGEFDRRGTILLRHVQDVAVGNFRGNASQDIAVLFDNISLTQTALNLYVNEDGKFPAFVAIPVGTLDTFDPSCRVYSGNFSGTRNMDLAVVCPSRNLEIHVGANDGKGAFRFRVMTTRDAQTRVDQIIQQMLDILRNQPIQQAAR